MRLSSSVQYLSVAALLVTSLHLPGQSTPTAPAQGAAGAQPTIRATTNLVLVDVVATDRDRPVSGLDRKSFHVFENGKEVPISSVEERKSAPLVTPPAFIAAPLPANTWTNLPIYPSSSAMNVLLLDALNTPLHDQMYVRRKMIDYLEKIQPGTTLAVFTLSDRLRMITPFTTDAGALVKVLKGSKTTPKETVFLDSPASSNLANNQMSSVAGPQTASPISPAPALTMDAVQSLRQFGADQIAFGTAVRVDVTLSAMQQLGEYLSKIEGRKNVIWISGGFPLVIFPDAALFNPFANAAGYNQQIEKTTRLLAKARVAIYPVDAHGLMVPSEYNAANNSGPINEDFATQLMNEEAQHAGEQEMMQEVAKETGGKAYVETNDLDKAAEDAISNGSDYYAIAYTPPKEHIDGKYHKIEVRVDGERGLKLAYRRGYYAEKPGTAPSDQSSPSFKFAAALAQDTPAATQILFRARVIPASDPILQGAESGTGPAGQMTLTGTPHRYVIDLTIDPHGLTFSPGSDGVRHAAMELAIAAYDADGNMVNFYQHSFQVGLKDAQFDHVMNSGIVLRLPLDLPAGKLALRLGVHDLNANRAGSLEVPLQVSAP